MTSTKDENRFFSINHQAVELIGLWAIKKGKIYSKQRIKNICELYGLLKNIWKKGNPPFCLKGKSGKWKKITQSWLAEKSACSIKTIERRLRDLQDIGLIKYERHGYISHKYVQFLPLTNISNDDLTDKSMSVPYQSNCSLSKRKIVFNAEDKLSEPNIKREGKDKKEVFIDKRYKLPEELNFQKDLIEKFWKNRTKPQNMDIWKWQINEMLLIKNKYGEESLNSQLNQALSKGWNSIDILNYEKFNKVESETNKSHEITEKRIENMKIHVKYFGIKSIYYEDEKFKAEYRKLLLEEN